MKFSAIILRNLSRKIDSGYPITAIATANHYLKLDCPIRKALATKAAKKMAAINRYSQKILEGEKLEKAKLSNAIRNSDHGIKARKRNIPTKYGRLNSGRRIASRSRKNYSMAAHILCKKNWGQLLS